MVGGLGSLCGFARVYQDYRLSHSSRGMAWLLCLGSNHCPICLFPSFFMALWTMNPSAHCVEFQPPVMCARTVNAVGMWDCATSILRGVLTGRLPQVGCYRGECNLGSWRCDSGSVRHAVHFVQSISVAFEIFNFP